MNDIVMNELIESVRVIVASYKAENYKTGREFNVFRVQRIASDEVRVCRMIREILDPLGSHGQGNIFLKQFVKDVLGDNFSEIKEDDLDKAKVVCEEVIDEYRRIDIVIRIGKRLIPIETKIFARDQNKQCKDYYDYAQKYDSNTKIYYLTLDGHEPSDESKNGLTEEQYKCISFSQHILNWLENCINLREIEQIYPVREIFIQFRDSIKQLTGKQDGVLTMLVKDKIKASSEYFLSALEIEKAIVGAKIDKMQEVFGAIDNHMKNLGFNDSVGLYKKESEDYYSKEKKTWPSLNYILPVNDSEFEGKFVLRFEIENRLYFGISPWNGNNNEVIKSEKSAEYINRYFTIKDQEIDESWNRWYWWKYLNKNVDFREYNLEYQKLFDKNEFDVYIKNIINVIDNYLKGVNLFPSNMKLS